ncbi:nitroreductase [Dactylosporangium sp. NPDC051484]|uniref:Acg family FMN-binding oxidoreductase n=1 Tax=Dactylosporangium sp. NPDC051484 TaxID=3154942 RepID=UPI00344CE9AC
MPANQKNPRPGPATTFQVRPVCRTLARAALAALHAPSVLNTQPWRWHIVDETAMLYADQRRRLHAVDTAGRLLVLSCGTALHHACVTLAADGVDFEVRPFPAADDPDLLAEVRYRGEAQPSAEAQRLRRAITLRRSDRRPFAGTAVPGEALDGLRDAAERNGAHLHLAWSRDLTGIALAAGRAAAVQLADPAYRAELAAWIRQPGEGHDGVTVDTLAPAGARPVPIRDFHATGMLPGASSDADLSDREARYGIVVTDGDGPADWLTAGVALSAVLLTATADHLATSAMSDLVENEAARIMLRRTLGNVGYPQIGIRIGVPSGGPPLPKAPRRPSAEVIEVVAEPVPGDAVPPAASP